MSTDFLPGGSWLLTCLGSLSRASKRAISVAVDTLLITMAYWGAYWIRELEIILEEVRNDLREKIRIAYNEQFDYLERVAKEQNVPVSELASRENTILAKTTPDNILVLKGNINTDTFYQEQIAHILDYANKHKPQEPGKPAGGGGDPVPPVPQKKVRQASLQTKTSIPLSTEEDIDRYLKGLKEQITKLLVDYDSVMIIK